MKRCLVACLWMTGCLIPEKQLSDASGPWGTPTRVFPDSTGGDDHPTLTRDALEMFFVRSSDIYTTRRMAVGMPWSSPALVAELSTPAKESSPEISQDPEGLTIYLASNPLDATRGDDIYVATRQMRGGPWSTPVLVDALNSPQDDKCATPTDDSDVMVVVSGRMPADDLDLYMTTKQGNGPWATPVPIDGPNTTFEESGPFLSSERLSLYFYSDRNGHDNDLFVATRANTDAAFSAGRPIDELDTVDDESNPWVTPDERDIVFERGTQLYEARR